MVWDDQSGIPKQDESLSILITTALLLRVKDWLKNLFVLVPVIFSERFLDPAALRQGGTAFIAFCLTASAMYILNDLKDRKVDAIHPRKRRRPIASGQVSARSGIGIAIGLLVIAFVVSDVLLGDVFTVLLGAYVINTLAYVVWLKYRVIIDVIIIACGFVIRLVAGCAAVQVEPSPWLIVCGFSLALVLGFGKRLAEVELPDVSPQHRQTLLAYSREKLLIVLAVCTGVCLMSYMLYTVAPETVERHGTRNLVYTVPVVAYGLFRYCFKALEARGDGPTTILVEDPVFFICGMFWASSVLAILVWK